MDQQQLIDRLREWWAEPGWLTSTDPDKADLLAAAAAEIERLRRECHSIIREADTLLTHVDIDVDFRYYQGQAAAAKRLLAMQPLPHRR